MGEGGGEFENERVKMLVRNFELIPHRRPIMVGPRIF